MPIITKQVEKVAHRFIHRYQPVIKRLIIPVLTLEFHPVRCYVTVEFGKLEFQAKTHLRFVCALYVLGTRQERRDERWAKVSYVECDMWVSYMPGGRESIRSQRQKKSKVKSTEDYLYCVGCVNQAGRKIKNVNRTFGWQVARHEKPGKNSVPCDVRANPLDCLLTFQSPGVRVMSTSMVMPKLERRKGLSE